MRHFKIQHFKYMRKKMQINKLTIPRIEYILLDCGVNNSQMTDVSCMHIMKEWIEKPDAKCSRKIKFNLYKYIYNYSKMKIRNVKTAEFFLFDVNSATETNSAQGL